jgi:uncharacterized HhH-GPD family protein
MDPEELDRAFKGPPALHRFPGSMAKRTQEMCRHLVEHHGGSAADVWEDAADGADLLKRLQALPGYGAEKSRIFIAILAKRLDIRPDGWEQAAGPFADDTPRSVADIHDELSLAKVRDWKRAQKAAKKAKTD